MKVMSQGTISHKRLVLLAVMVLVSVGLVCATAEAAVVYRLVEAQPTRRGVLVLVCVLSQ
jgi:hypothetical protein